MRTFRHLTVAAVAAAVLAGGASTNAAAADPLGEHVAMCAAQLGQRADAPAVTCALDGMTMTFANFGAMLEHMLQMH